MENNNTNNEKVYLKFEDGDFEKMGQYDKALMSKFIQENEEIGIDESILVEFGINMWAKGTFSEEAFRMFMKELGITKLTLDDNLEFDFQEEKEGK